MDKMPWQLGVAAGLFFVGGVGFIMCLGYLISH